MTKEKKRTTVNKTLNFHSMKRCQLLEEKLKKKLLRAYRHSRLCNFKHKEAMKREAYVRTQEMSFRLNLLLIFYYTTSKQ